MSSLSLVAFIIALFAAVGHAQNAFLQPWTAGVNKDYSENLDYAVGEIIITEWSVDYSKTTITLNQDNNPGDAQGGPSRVLEQGYNKTTWSWTVSYEGMDPSYNNVFYFSVSQADGSDSFTSHYFNISKAPATKTTVSTTAAATRMTSTTVTASTATTPAAASTSTTLAVVGGGGGGGIISPTQSPNPGAGTGTPVATIAGVVVGIVAGFIVLMSAIWWGWKTFNKRWRRGGNAAAQPSSFSYIGAPGQIHPGDERSHRRKPFELVGNQAYEMHAGVHDSLHESGGRAVHELHQSEVGRR